MVILPEKSKAPGFGDATVYLQQPKMEQTYIADTTFDHKIISDHPLEKGEYENCRFANCDFSEADWSDIKFTECEFIACNLSLVALSKTAFRDVKFKDCKMLGLHFDTCNGIGLSFMFDGCQLNHTTFYKTKIRKTIFRNTKLQEVDFAECDLTDSLFENCDLSRANFENTIIEKADFRTSFNYSIDPEINRIRKAKFSMSGLPGLLEKYNIDIEGM